MSSVASYCNFASCIPPWRYPVKAFCPHGALMGFDIGAKADTERYCFAFDARYVVNAPWPPMLWPNIDIRVRSCTVDSADAARNKCQSSRSVDQNFPELVGSQIGCACACCNGGHTLDLWRLGRSLPLKKRVEVKLWAWFITVGVGLTCAKIVMIIFTFDTCTTRRSISEEDGDSFLGGRAKKVSLLSADGMVVCIRVWYFDEQA